MIQKFLNYNEPYVLISFDIQTHLTLVDVLFRIKQHNCRKVKTKQIIILIAKMCISMYKKANAFLPLSIFENQVLKCLTATKLKNENCVHCD